MIYSLLISLFFSFIPVSINNSCSTLIHIGDSITVHSQNQQHKEYKKLNFSRIIINSAGSRSIHGKKSSDNFTGYQAVKYYKSKNHKNTCWVIALGTNDSGYLNLRQSSSAIESIMTLIKKDKIIWIDVWKSNKKKNRLEATTWNKSLSKTLSKYPNAYVYSWSTYVASHRRLLNPDGIHYNLHGSNIRAKQIANFVSDTFISKD